MQVPDPFVPSLRHGHCVIPNSVRLMGWSGPVGGSALPLPPADPVTTIARAVVTATATGANGDSTVSADRRAGIADHPGRGYPGARISARDGLTVLAVFGAIIVINSTAVRPLVRAARQLGGPWWWHLQLVLGGVVLQYGLMALLCLAACRRWGCGSPGPDLGLRIHRGDVADGVTGWLAGLALISVLAMALRRLGIPAASNNPLTSGAGDVPLGLPQWALITLVGVVMVVVAPVLEELLFRGVLLRALTPTWPLPLALGAQAVLFGAFHVDPGRGSANIGLVVVLSGIGLVLGWLVHRRQGRLAAGIVAHSLQNAVALVVGLNLLL